MHYVTLTFDLLTWDNGSTLRITCAIPPPRLKVLSAYPFFSYEF